MLALVSIMLIVVSIALIYLLKAAQGHIDDYTREYQAGYQAGYRDGYSAQALDDIVDHDGDRMIPTRRH